MNATNRTLALEEVAEHFEDWRRNRHGRGRIPEQLWSEALSQLSNHSMNSVAKTLRLNPTDLKKRAIGNKETDRANNAFVQLHFQQQQDLVANETLSGKTPCRIELLKADGNRMIISDLNGTEALRMIQFFLES